MGGRTDNYPVKDNPGTGEVAWLLKCLLYKNKSLSSDPWHHVKAGCDGMSVTPDLLSRGWEEWGSCELTGWPTLL